MTNANKNLHQAKRAKKDEFYTQLTDVESELFHYRHHFKDKVVYLNCDDPVESAFWTYFSLNFDFFGLKQLTSTHYDPDKPTYRLDLYEYDTEPVKTPLEGNGDFRNPESIKILEEADVVVTNPPFSLFREYLAQLIEYGKEFVIMGSLNAITYKEVFPLIKDGKIWLGIQSGAMTFKIPKDRAGKVSSAWTDENGVSWQKLGNIVWFTNLDHKRRHEEILLWTSYNPDLHPKYDNYDAIEVSRVKDIPDGYTGAMGVPITFLGRHNPDQFEILGSRRWAKKQELLDLYCGEVDPPENDKKTLIDGRETYDRIFIRHRNPAVSQPLAA